MESHLISHSATHAQHAKFSICLFLTWDKQVQEVMPNLPQRLEFQFISGLIDRNPNFSRWLLLYLSQVTPMHMGLTA